MSDCKIKFAVLSPNSNNGYTGNISLANLEYESQAFTMRHKKMSPKSVKLFEVFFLVFLVIGILSGSTIWIFGALGAGADEQIQIAAVQCGLFFTILALVLLISRKRNNIARWLLLAICLTFMIFDVPSAGIMNTHILTFIRMYMLDYKGGVIFGAISAIQIILQIVAFYLIFRANAAPWFQNRKD